MLGRGGELGGVTALYFWKPHGLKHHVRSHTWLRIHGCERPMALSIPQLMYTHPESSLLHPCTDLLDPVCYQINLLIRWSKTRTFHQPVMDMSVNWVHTASNHLHSHAVYIIDTLLLKTVKQQARINMSRRGSY